MTETNFGPCAFCDKPSVMRIRTAIGYSWWRRLLSRQQITVCADHVSDGVDAVREHYSYLWREVQP